MYYKLQRTEILCSAHNAFMRSAWISEQTAIISLYSINLSVIINEAEYLLRGTDWVFKSDSYSFVLNLLKPTGYVMHHQFNIQQLYALPILYLCVLYLSENKQRLVLLAA